MPERSCPYTPDHNGSYGSSANLHLFVSDHLLYFHRFPSLQGLWNAEASFPGELKCGGYGIIVFIYSDAVNIAVI